MEARSGRCPAPALAAVLLAFLPWLAGCSDGRGEASLSVKLEYAGGSVSQAPARAATVPPPYPVAPDDRILIRVLAPHMPAPIEAWFDRSAGRGEISGIPAGSRIAIEVDEYDNTARTLFKNAPLLGRGWAYGITLAPGESKTVPVTMYEKGTMVRFCGNPPLIGAGVAGDTGDGGLAVDAALGRPLAVEAGPDDSIYVSSGQYNRIRKVDRYGYITHYAGNGGAVGPIVEGQIALNAPFGPLQDLDITSDETLYAITMDQQIVSVNKITGRVSIKYNDYEGVFNIAFKVNLAVVNDNDIYYTNGMENRIFRIQGGLRSEYLTDNNAFQTQEGASRLSYGVRYPSSITYKVQGDVLLFADRDNDRIKRIPLAVGNVYTEIGSTTEIPFQEGIKALLMTPLNPVMVEYDTYTGNLFFAEENLNQIKYLSLSDNVYTLAGNGMSGFSGDGEPAISARLDGPSSITCDSRGNVYIADTGNHAIRMVVGGAHQ